MAGVVRESAVRESAVSAVLDLAAAQEALDAQPFSRLVQARITEFGHGAATLEIDIREELRQQHGFVHGGVLSYAADNTLTFAAATALGPAIVTGGFSIQYLRPAVGRTLRARAEVVQAGRRQAVCRCDLTVIGAEGRRACARWRRGRYFPSTGRMGGNAEG